jgi:Domain of unknown function (DUF4349)
MRPTRTALSVLVVATLLGTAACSGTGSDGGATSGSAPAASGTTEPAAASAAGAASAAPPTTSDGFSGGQAEAVDQALQRSIIRTAALTIRTSAVAADVAKAENAAQTLGGLVGDAQVSTDPDHPGQTTATLTLRVPGAQYDQLMTVLAKLGQVVSKTEKADDVTSQVVDVNSRLATQRKSLEQVRALLSRAGSLSQLLLVENNLTQREADLESLEAQQKLLADETALATVSLTLVTPKAAPPPPPPARHLGFVTGLIAGWHGLARTTVVSATAVGAVLPFAVPVILVLGLALFLWRRRSHLRPRATAVADAD